MTLSTLRQASEEIKQQFKSQEANYNINNKIEYQKQNYQMDLKYLCNNLEINNNNKKINNKII